MEVALRKGGGGQKPIERQQIAVFITYYCFMISLTMHEFANTKKCIFFRMYPFNGSLEPPANSLSGLFLDLDDEES